MELHFLPVMFIPALFQFLVQDSILVLGLLLELYGYLLVLGFHVFFLPLYLLVPLTQLLAPNFQILNRSLQLLHPRPRIRQRQLRLLKPRRLLPQIIPLLNRHLQRILQLFILLLNLIHHLLILQNLHIDLIQLLLMYLDQMKILPGDVSIEILHIPEGLLMILHQIIYMLVLPLLNLMRLHLQPQLQLLLQLLQFLLILNNQTFLLQVQTLVYVLDIQVKFLIFLFDDVDMSVFNFFILLLQLLFILSQIFIVVAVHPLLLAHVLLSILEHPVALSPVLVFEMLHFLHVHLDLCLMRVLEFLHLGFVVQDLSFDVLGLVLRAVRVKVVDHVFFDLDDVTFDLGVVEPFL